MRDLRKILTFAVAGAIGCIVAGLLGELWLLGTRQPVEASAPESGPFDICLVLDCSGSMAGRNLAEMKAAAVDFARGRGSDRIGVVAFGSQAQVAASIGPVSDQLVQSLQQVDDGGSTNMAAGLSSGLSLLTSTERSQAIMVFTDGVADDEYAALAVGQACRERNVQLVAVATNDADFRFLARLTRDPKLVIPAQAGQFENAFKQASAAIGRQQLVESSGSGGSAFFETLRLLIWSGAIATGLAVALVAGQNYYFRRPLLRFSELPWAALGGLAGGAISGGLVQTLFVQTTDASAGVVAFGRLLGWLVLGMLVGLALAYFVPNLQRMRGLLGGALGGIVGGVFFLIASLALGDVLGRLMGVAILGFAIGAMIAFAEVASRQAWLVVQYNVKESRTISLGVTPVLVGSDRERCQVCTANVPALALKYSFQQGQVTVEDMPRGTTQTVASGDARQLGSLRLVVHQAIPNATRGGSEASATHSSAAPTSTLGGKAVTDGKSAAGAVVTGHALRIRDTSFSLGEGARFTARQLNLTDGFAPATICAEVVQNPTDPTVLGLKNLTATRWRATLPTGELRDIEPGRSIKLAPGTRVQIGQLVATIEAI